MRSDLDPRERLLLVFADGEVVILVVLGKARCFKVPTILAKLAVRSTSADEVISRVSTDGGIAVCSWIGVASASA